MTGFEGQPKDVAVLEDAKNRWCFGRDSVIAAIEDIKKGKLVVVVDDEDRENEGDLIMAAEHATKETIAFMIKHTSGVICCAIEQARAQQLELPPMVEVNEDAKCTAFTVSVDLKEDGMHTGISATDRARTLQALADESSTPQRFSRPGHIFPLTAVQGGVLAREGHTEASVDLCKLAGCKAAGVLCEIVTEDGADMMRTPELRQFAANHGLVFTSIQDMRLYIKSPPALRITLRPMPPPTASYRDGASHGARSHGVSARHRREAATSPRSFLRFDLAQIVVKTKCVGLAFQM
eukprot:CAMPEP_0196718078 /NCGR_PEP_ID=MMETSP1091-20130531/1361_1 /TAXON_ID=302021 /ORGANISM="Rhodomonas sp., Strain CCMP768" /LENGTH=292 /DNA_ID=CAMNT_0042058655 /DNA_START=43 /DNA_END=920 /DNA_ORIENTATION=+